MRPAGRLSLRPHSRVAVLFMVPALAVMAIFLLGPVLWALRVSLTNMALEGPAAASPAWVGLSNFSHILRDPDFFQALRASLTYLAGSAVIGQAVMGMLLALLMKGRHPLFKAILGGIIVAAWVIPEVVAGYLWHAVLLPDGMLNTILSTIGLPRPDWQFGDQLSAIIVANTWRGTAFSMLVFASAVEGIAPEWLEAAGIDGAGLPQRIWYIILPLLRGAIATDLILITLATLSDFTLVFVLTGGLSEYGAQVVTVYSYQQAFGADKEIGLSTAISLLLIAVGALLSILYVRVLNVEV